MSDVMTRYSKLCTCISCFYQLRQLRRVRRYLHKEAAEQ